MGAECRRLREPSDTGPDCGCSGESCALDIDSAATTEPKGYFAWLLAEGTERVTVHHLADLAGKRVSDVIFTLDCAGIDIDRETRTVAIRDLIGANLA